MLVVKRNGVLRLFLRIRLLREQQEMGEEVIKSASRELRVRRRNLA